MARPGPSGGRPGDRDRPGADRVRGRRHDRRGRAGHQRGRLPHARCGRPTRPHRALRARGGSGRRRCGGARPGVAARGDLLAGGRFGDSRVRGAADPGGRPDTHLSRRLPVRREVGSGRDRPRGGRARARCRRGSARARGERRGTREGGAECRRGSHPHRRRAGGDLRQRSRAGRDGDLPRAGTRAGGAGARSGSRRAGSLSVVGVVVRGPGGGRGRPHRASKSTLREISEALATGIPPQTYRS